MPIQGEITTTSSGLSEPADNSPNHLKATPFPAHLVACFSLHILFLLPDLLSQLLPSTLLLLLACSQSCCNWLSLQRKFWCLKSPAVPIYVSLALRLSLTTAVVGWLLGLVAIWSGSSVQERWSWRRTGGWETLMGLSSSLASSLRGFRRAFGSWDHSVQYYYLCYIAIKALACAKLLSYTQFGEERQSPYLFYWYRDSSALSTALHLLYARASPVGNRQLC